MNEYNEIISKLRILWKKSEKPFNEFKEKLIEDLDTHNFWCYCEESKKEVSNWPSWQKNVLAKYVPNSGD